MPIEGAFPDKPIGMKVVGHRTDGRPIIKHMDGSVSSGGTVPFEIDPDQWVNVPLMFQGKSVTPDEAVEFVKRRGWVDPDTAKKLPVFGSKAKAEEAARVEAHRLVHCPQCGSVLDAGEGA